MKRFVFVFLVLALAVAGAKTYSITLFQPSVVGQTELKPGDYRVEVQDTKVVIKNGNQTVESAVKVEKANEKFSATSVRYASSDGKYRINEIRLGGTNMKLVFD